MASIPNTAPKLPTAAAGTPAKGKPGAKKGADRVAPDITDVVDNVPMPVKAGKSSYNFAGLTKVGMSFGIKNKKAANMSSIVSNQNKKEGPLLTNADGTPVIEHVEMKDASGVVIGTAPQHKRGHAPQFKAFDVDARKDPQGASVRVFRTA